MTNGRYALTLFAACATILIATSMLARGGPLDPPAGPIAPTMKTLSDVEARTPVSHDTTPGDSANIYIIDEPGSYYLTGNLMGEVGKTGIRITASPVVLDLNGFSLEGVAESREGIRIYSNDVVVRNGFLRNWGRQGLRAFSELSQRSAIIENIHAVDNGNDGIEIYTGGVVRNCVAHSNDGHGIKTYINCLIEGCISRNNVENGFNTSSACVIRRCSAYQNFGSGFDVGRQSQIVECTSNGNILFGYESLSSCAFSSCSADLNLDDGFSCDDYTVLRGCAAGSNGGAGFDLESGCVVTESVAGSNEAGGILTEEGSVVTTAAGRDNTGVGAFIGRGGAGGFVSGTRNSTGVFAGGAVIASGARGNTNLGHNVIGMLTYSIADDNWSGISGGGSVRIHGCASRSNDYHGFTQNGSPNIFSANSAFFNGDANYFGTYTGQNATTPIGADAWQNTAESLP